MHTVFRKFHHVSPRSRQAGAATFAVAIVLLLLTTMVGVYTSHSVLLEQNISANDFRSRQAFEAAESGLSIAIAYISGRGAGDKDDDGVLDPVFDTDGDGVGDTASLLQRRSNRYANHTHTRYNG